MVELEKHQLVGVCGSPVDSALYFENYGFEVRTFTCNLWIFLHIFKQIYIFFLREIVQRFLQNLRRAGTENNCMDFHSFSYFCYLWLFHKAGIKAVGLGWTLTFSSPVALAKFCRFAGIFSVALSQWVFVSSILKARREEPEGGHRCD